VQAEESRLRFYVYRLNERRKPTTHSSISASSSSNPPRSTPQPFQPPRNLNTFPKIDLALLLRHIVPTRDTQYPHTPRILQPMQQLRRDQEVLTASTITSVDVAIDAVSCKLVAFGIAGAASYVHHAFVDEALVAGVHALVDFVDDAEGGAG